MENNELLKRADDLCRRAKRSGMVTHSSFLTPAERVQVGAWARYRADCKLVFSGGHPACERQIAFFLPDYLEAEDLDLSETVYVMKLTAAFGTPGHRDYLGAVLGMGVGREWVGDIWVQENAAYVFCQQSVLRHLLSIDKVGRYGVKTKELPLEAVPAPERKVKQKSFSVQSLRLDAVVGGMFNLSRTEAARQISAGNVSLNYLESNKTDCVIKEGDILSLRGAGKGAVTGIGGTSRKGRLFVYAEIYQ